MELFVNSKCFNLSGFYSPLRLEKKKCSTLRTLSREEQAIKNGSLILRNVFELLKVCVLAIYVASSFQMLFIQDHLLLYKTSRMGTKKAVL